MFGENEMEDGDQLTISIKLDMMFGENEMEEDDDQDGLTTREYKLDSFIAHNVPYKGYKQFFKAFSQKNSNTRGRAIKVYQGVRSDA
ncbi:hypothetical protein Tco_0157039 [Tanacetum coccineum]